MPTTISIGIVGGGVSGTMFLHQIVELNKKENFSFNLKIDLFDQGRSGLGGRSSHRNVKEEEREYDFDHGCQFFRADTLTMRNIISKFIESGNIIEEWKANFDFSEQLKHCDFFGMPGNGPFYVGVGGMHNFPRAIVNAAEEMIKQDTNKNININIYPQTRVSKLVHRNNKNDNSSNSNKNNNRKKNLKTNLWELVGTNGNAAFHDTKESVAQLAKHKNLNDKETNSDGVYDFIILTDISSTSFDSWHRASAGVPDSFSKAVRDRVGARVPLFSAMVAFETPLPLTSDTITFPIDENGDGGDCWFAAKTNSKPGFEHLKAECWTIVSTPIYAANQIKLVPMQDVKTGEFIPQEPGYLKNVPAKQLVSSFLKAMNISDSATPNILHLNAQRWGSALPAPNHHVIGNNFSSRWILSGVNYDVGKSKLYPTTINEDIKEGSSFYYDDKLSLMQIGDMISNYTPGMESGVLSAVEGATFLMEMLKSSSSSSSIKKGNKHLVNGRM